MRSSVSAKSAVIFRFYLQLTEISTRKVVSLRMTRKYILFSNSPVRPKTYSRESGLLFQSREIRKTRGTSFKHRDIRLLLAVEVEVHTVCYSNRSSPHTSRKNKLHSNRIKRQLQHVNNNYFSACARAPISFLIFFAGVSFEAFISLAETRKIKYFCLLPRPNIGAITLERTPQGVWSFLAHHIFVYPFRA